MRLQVEVFTTAERLPWPQVLSPGRALVYGLLEKAAPELGSRLHDVGWGPHRMVPVGHSAPVFPGASRRRGVYSVGGRGLVELGSPLPEVVLAWAAALQETEVLDWGGIALRVSGVAVVDPPPFSDGVAQLRSGTPVVMKGSGRDERGVRTTRQAWLLPWEPEFPAYFQNNLRRKAETVGLSPEVELQSIDWVGPKRSFSVGPGLKPGAQMQVVLRGDPAVLQMMWSWGLGQSNSAGFGWVVA